ncbi:MAG: DUF6236 family protein [Solidesulfovibrio sp.]
MFDHALYYPYIDILDSSFLKTSLLYWDKISTIVPRQETTPYRNHETSLLSAENILTPYHISSNKKVTTEALDSITHMLHTEEFVRSLNYTQTEMAYIHRSKLPLDISRLFESGFDRTNIHREKLPYHLRNIIEDSFPELQHSDYVDVSSSFGLTYMTALANAIAKEENLSCLTNFSLYNDLSIRAKNPIQIQHPRDLRNIATGILARLTIDRIGIKENVPLEKILEFRNRYQDEMMRFREAIRDLVTSLEIDRFDTIEKLIKYLKQIQKNKVAQSIKNLKRSLSTSAIDIMLNNFTIANIVTLIGTSSISFLGTEYIPIAAGLTISTGLYSISRHNNRVLNENPYTYAFLLNKRFGYDI